MPATRHVTVKDGDVLVLLGTTKGVFLLRSDRARKRWDLGGPYCPGEEVYAVAYDGRGGRRRLWAGARSFHFGATLRTSDDFGHTWADPEVHKVRFPEDSGQSLQRVWQIKPGRADEPNTIYCGVEPAALFESRDAGETWSLVQGLHDHPHRSRWQPGGGGLCLHTIVVDPSNRQRMFVAISAAGVYRTDDGGRTWQVKNQGIRAEFMPDKYPEFGQCVHKVVMHPSRPDRLFLQNHWGLYRSDDAGDSWNDIANGVPSDFGFAMEMHPHDPDTVYIVPIESDGFRCMPEGKLRVYRTRNAGASWEPLTKGLPQKNALETVLRDTLIADVLNPAGVYFGTRSGKVYGSADGGTSWLLLMDGLPAVTCVKSAVIGDGAESPMGKSPAAKAAMAPRRAGRARRAGPRRPRGAREGRPGRSSA